MKQTKHIKLARALPTTDRNGFSKVSRLYFDAGFYANRPHIKNHFHQTHIGKLEGFRFVESL